MGPWIGLAVQLAILGAIAYLVYRHRSGPLGQAFRMAVTGLAWFAVGLVALVGGGLIIGGFVTAPWPAKLLMLGLGAAGWFAWRARHRAVQEQPQRVARIDRVAFVSAYGVYLGVAVAWLVLGLLPALAAAFPAFEDWLREWGTSHDTVLGDFARRAAGASRNSSSGVQVTLDYAFSLLNLTLATFLVVKVRGNRTANLLAIGMVGTAVAFNLQSHSALLIIGDTFGGLTQSWHDLGVHVLAGIAYVFALLLFPDGAIDRSRGPHLMGLAVFFGLFSFIAISDHTSALVLLFGVLVPAAALIAHSRRFREAQSPEMQQLFRLLRFAMGVSLVGAITVLMVTSVIKSSDERFTQTTRDYEVEPLAAGTYYFFCDPHIDPMQGRVIVTEPDPDEVGEVQTVSITAHGSEFDKTELELPANQTSVIRFKNTDGVEHNVSIWRDYARTGTPLLDGELFTGQDLATFTFRVFRFVFAIIPLALFVAILRFHLWDVDRLRNRAMVYGALTGVLGFAYAVGALIVGLLPSHYFNQGELVAVWILAAALLFRPVRRRLQTIIDRRFYREKLDAVRTLESFSAHVRDQVDLDQLADELVSVVSETMHPTQVTLWIRDGEGASFPSDTLRSPS